MREAHHLNITKSVIYVFLHPQDSDFDVEMEEKKEKKPTDKVQGLGFKDKAAAEGTLKELEGRDPEYQRLAINGLLGSARRVLASQYLAVLLPKR